LLCWHGDSLPDSADSPKPQALRVPPLVGQGLTESAPPGRPRVRQPSKKSNGTSDVPKGVPLVLFPRNPRYETVISQRPQHMAGGAVPSSGKESRLIFPGWLPCGGIWQWDFVKPAVRAWENPTGGLHSNRASRGNPRFEDPQPLFQRGLVTNCKSTSLSRTFFIAFCI